MKTRLLITDRFSANAFAFLRAQTDFETAMSSNFEPNIEELAKVEGLIIRSRTLVNQALLEKAPDLRVIVTATSGFDHIDFALCAARGITIMHTPNANVQSAAELTWALVLAAARRVPEAHRAVKAGEWRRDTLVGSELCDKTYGIIGLGRIGSRVAKLAHAFGMKVIAYDPYKDDSRFKQVDTARVSLEEVLKLADVLSLHVPATLETKHMLNRANLEGANRSMILVNTSRGQVLHEADLCEALEKGWIKAAALDVFEKEPLQRNSPLFRFNNVILSPHLGATTGEAFDKASIEAAQKVIAYFRSREISDRLPPQEPWFVA